MNYDVVLIAKQGLVLSLILSLPVIVVASVVGLLFSLFQALTQIQDQTLSFAIKLSFIMLVIYSSADWVGSKLFAFSIMVYNLI